jgi:hypothetical protein
MMTQELDEKGTYIRLVGWLVVWRKVTGEFRYIQQALEKKKHKLFGLTSYLTCMQHHSDELKANMAACFI